ncbi:MAG: glycerol acyltransferase [Sphingobacteriaceae bacterium]|nr:MAG: glycerol acyltransferase [Sphingobacteriaceae bacterium]
MIAAKRNTVIHWFFQRYINHIVKNNFHTVNFNAVEVDEQRSVLLVANHFSWWDGFILFYLSNRLFKKRFHIMVLEETVRKVSFMKYMGAFSVAKNSKDIVASLNYAAELLQDAGNMVVIFPQGKLYSNFVDDVHVEKGVLNILSKAQEKTQLIFVATFIEHLQYKKPQVNVYLNKQSSNHFANINELKQAYSQHYKFAKQQQTQIVI